MLRFWTWDRREWRELRDELFGYGKEIVVVGGFWLLVLIAVGVVAAWLLN